MISQKNPCFTGNNISSSQWLLLLDQLNIGAFTIDLLRRITSFNQSARALLGLEEVEVIGRDCREVFRGVPCRLKCPFQIGWDPEAKDLEVEVLDASDKKRLVTRLAAPLYDQDQNLAGCLTILQDRSPLADLIDRVSYGEKSLKIILDNLDVAIFGVNRGGYITFFNTAAETITGYNRRQVLGKSCQFILGPGDDQGLALLKESMTDGQPRTTDKAKINSRDGEAIDVKADYMPLTNDQGKIIGGLVTLHDLTLAQQLDQVITDHYTFHNMIGKDPAMQKIFEMIGIVADSEATVLIEGATGTGKDLLAKVIHSASPRSNKFMVKVNCAALPDNLLESEIFGYVKGAFTGADRDKPGRFQEADGGTILLDEIGDLPLSLQAKLLRVLEDKEFYPLGSRHTVKVDVRIIAASNRSLERLLAKGLFREDLFYRLNVLRIEIPCLKDRRADLPILIRNIMRRSYAAKEKRPPEISEKAMEILLKYDYPGNIRELENILEYALLICQGHTIQPEHLHGYVQTRLASLKAANLSPLGLETNPDDRERNKIISILERHSWHRQKTARALGIDRTTLWRKMKRFGLAS